MIIVSNLSEQIVEFRKLTNQVIENDYDDQAFFLSYLDDEGKIVGCARGIVLDNKLSNSEYFAAGHNFPNYLIDNCAEGGYLYVLPEYRHKKVAYDIIMSLFELLKGMGIPYLVCGTAPNHLSMYERIGFELIETKKVKARDKEIDSSFLVKKF